MSPNKTGTDGIFIISGHICSAIRIFSSGSFKLVQYPSNMSRLHINADQQSSDT